MHTHASHHHHQQQEQQIAGINNHWSLMSLNISGLNFSTKKTQTNKMDIKGSLTFCCTQETYLTFLSTGLSWPGLLWEFVPGLSVSCAMFSLYPWEASSFLGVDERRSGYGREGRWGRTGRSWERGN